MKLSVSLSEEDVARLDDYARAAGLPSRSAALQRAIRLLCQRDLQREYEEAFAVWEASGDRTLWEAGVGDGLDDVAR